MKTILAEIAREHHYADKLGDRLGDEELTGEALAPLDVVTRDRVGRGLEHLFNELAILLGSEAVRICFRALHQDDERARGTALEYLQTVLPPELRDAIWPLLGEEVSLPSVRPAAGVVLEDLARERWTIRTAPERPLAASSPTRSQMRLRPEDWGRMPTSGAFNARARR